jgi:phosphatidate cytidylyltransferase
VLVLFPDNVHLLPVVYVLVTFSAAGLRNRMHEVVKQIAFSIIGSIWIGYFLALLVALRDEPQGPTLMTVIIGGVILSDVFAYLFGITAKKIRVGTTALASNISPNKVIAGVLGNIVGVLIAMLAYGLGLGLSWPIMVTLVVLGGLAATYGDLAESIIKRHAGVKDSSTLIPFHGGMMDRIDSLLFVVPVYYLILNVSFDCPLF